MKAKGGLVDPVLRGQFEVDAVAIAFVVIASTDDAVLIGDEQAAVGGLGVVGEVVPGEDSCGVVSSTAC